MREIRVSIFHWLRYTALFVAVLVLACSETEQDTDDVAQSDQSLEPSDANSEDVAFDTIPAAEVGMEMAVEPEDASEPEEDAPVHDLWTDTGTDPDLGDPDLGGLDMGPEVCVVTESDAQGPYYIEGAPFKNPIFEEDEPGTRLIISGTIRGTDCQAVAEGVVDIWQTDADGVYPGANEGFRLRGKVAADEFGNYSFETVYPGLYEGRPRHVHLKISGEGFGTVTTQIYFAGDPYLWPVDSCGPPTCHSDDPLRIIELVSEMHDGEEKLVGSLDLVLP